jgi:hypothetical protein
MNFEKEPWSRFNSKFKYLDYIFINKFSIIINIFSSSFRFHEVKRTAGLTVGCVKRDVCSGMLSNCEISDDDG